MSVAPFAYDTKDEKNLILSKVLGMRQITEEAVGEYYVHLVNQKIGGAPWVINEIREGSNEVVPLALLQTFTPKELKKVICADSDIKWEQQAWP
ncbi:hypothetical protein HDE_04582 [Halotydeus destructor]|nr:hypothetical protein HDE_04582 [Halotydeus destructor]